MPPSPPSRCWTQRGSLASDPSAPTLAKRAGAFFYAPSATAKPQRNAPCANKWQPPSLRHTGN